MEMGIFFVYEMGFRPKLALELGFGPTLGWELEFRTPLQELQRTDIDAVAASVAMAKAKRRLTLLMEKESENMATKKHYLTKVNEDTYQSTQLNSFTAALDKVS